jgi:3-(3-hydroxy-phenyl)propionate hydroxylase
MTTPHPNAAARANEPPRVIVVGAGPVGCAAALLLADRGIPVTLLERHTRPHPLPRAVHLDDEVARVLHRVGVSDGFLAGARPGSGLRLLDARHRVMAEFRRELDAGDNGFPAANMFHQPDLEALLFDRIDRHPLVDLRRGCEVRAIDGVHDPLAVGPVRVHTGLVADGTTQSFTGRLLLGCDGANSTVRHLLGVPMQDLRFTENWLVVDARATRPLDTWDGVEQVCDPARAATFMHVAGDRYRWEFQLRDGETEADLIHPAALGQLLQPWTGRRDLDRLNIVRSTTYTFRARLATRFQVGRVFLLGDAAHLTPPFIGQGLGAGLRDADNLAWKIAHVLTGQAGPDLLATYQTERRPHVKALIRKAVLVGWAMTGGQDRAATVRKLVLGGIMRSPRVQELVGSTATPQLRTGALHRAPALSGVPRRLRPGGLIPNPICTTGGSHAMLDDVLCGQTAWLTGRRPLPHLLTACRAQGILPVQIIDVSAGAAGPVDPGWLTVHLTGSVGALHALIEDPTLGVLVRPDRVIAAVTTRSGIPRLPWTAPTTTHFETATT